MRYMDELRGSEGERCKVTDLRSGTIYDGTVEAIHEREGGAGKVIVRYDNGTLVSVGHSFVQLVEEEA